MMTKACDFYQNQQIVILIHALMMTITKLQQPKFSGLILGLLATMWMRSFLIVLTHIGPYQHDY